MTGIGIIGCGNISEAYLRLGPRFKNMEVRAVSDLNMDVAQARAHAFNVSARTVDALLASDDVDVIVNLTVPSAHYSVTKSILSAGKHAYCEKPLVLNTEEGKDLRALADASNLRVGSAPDTFLGGAHQAARAALDAGRIGKVLTGTAHVMGHGMEAWHPNPDFFFKPGGGPMLDMGPYYVTNLVQLIGPVRRVVGLASPGAPTRRIGSGPREGEEISVETPTTLHAILEFQSGAAITLSASWDVWAHRHGHMELYGEKGTLFLPDPNWFSGTVEIADQEGQTTQLDHDAHPFSVPNDDMGGHPMANYRMAGLADMVAALRDDRPHRCSLDMALHVVEVLTAILQTCETGTAITMQTSCLQPAPLDASAARALLH